VPKTKRGLGKGLEALIPPSPARHPGMAEVDLDAISPNPMQPRHPVPPDDLKELAESIREHGLIQPLVVTRSGEGAYQLIAGERRWRAAKLAGLTRAPVVIKEASPQQMLELALVENIQRADLNALEEAEAYRQLADEFDLTQEQIAQKVAKSRVAVANSLRLLAAGCRQTGASRRRDHRGTRQGAAGRQGREASIEGPGCRPQAGAERPPDRGAGEAHEPGGREAPAPARDPFAGDQGPGG